VSEPILITDAQASYDDDLAARKQRYKVMMLMRIPLMVLAALFYTVPWVAVTLLVLSIPLPWMAVLIANDRLPQEGREPRTATARTGPSSRSAATPSSTADTPVGSTHAQPRSGRDHRGMTPPQARVRLLGSAEVRVDGVRVPLGDVPRLESLVAFLLLHRGEPQPRPLLAARSGRTPPTPKR
jgi:hypothetical protein